MADLGQGSRPDDGASPSRGGPADWQARRVTGGGIVDFLRPQRLDDMLGQRLGQLVRSAAQRSMAQARSPDQFNPASMGSGSEQGWDGTHAASTLLAGCGVKPPPVHARRVGGLVTL
jgi:hypothetical protein